MFDTVLVADRGELACRIVRTCQRLGVTAVAVHSEADAKALHVTSADESVLLGPAAPAQSYLDEVKLVEAARQTGAQAIHPGHGFVAENAGFARAVLEAGLTWVGPSPEVMAALGDTVSARRIAAAAGVPVVAGSAESLLDVGAALDAARELGYPVMVRAAAAGDVQLAGDEAALRTAFDHAHGPGGSGRGVLLERHLAGARHVEVPILGLGDGRIVALAERDCSLQQGVGPVLAESPSPGVGGVLRAGLSDAARQVGAALGYTNAGSVEFLVEGDRFAFVRVSPRLQVEHPVTELVHDVDLVEQQLRIAAGEDLSGGLQPDPVGHAIELGVLAEGTGRIGRWDEPVGEGVRVDAGYRRGDEVSASSDPLLATLVVWGADRAQALARSRAAVAAFAIEGPRVNLPFLAGLLTAPELIDGSYDTALVRGLDATRGEATR